jgi:hypothetical protein
VSCNTISKDEEARIIPVKPPAVNKNRNPYTQYVITLFKFLLPYNEASHLKIFIPVGIAIIIVAIVKYARVSKSIPIVNI